MVQSAHAFRYIGKTDINLNIIQAVIVNYNNDIILIVHNQRAIFPEYAINE